jgi:hypothetical protein
MRRGSSISKIAGGRRRPDCGLLGPGLRAVATFAASSFFLSPVVDAFVGEAETSMRVER